MTGRSAAPLYTTDLLALAVSLADWPIDPTMDLKGEARSRTCGSTLTLTCSTDRDGRIARLGLRTAACAVGQAAAALFLQGAHGKTVAEVARVREQLAFWLDGSGAEPDWPGIARLAAARAHPARHGAMLLAWDAALAALSKEEARG